MRAKPVLQTTQVCDLVEAEIEDNYCSYLGHVSLRLKKSTNILFPQHIFRTFLMLFANAGFLDYRVTPLKWDAKKLTY